MNTETEEARALEIGGGPDCPPWSTTGIAAKEAARYRCTGPCEQLDRHQQRKQDQGLHQLMQVNSHRD
ncbi:MAG: hypothetical protein KDI44_02500 [Thiothrix sp.]|nr:hypothetical protein [Thiothrix sp.]